MKAIERLYLYIDSKGYKPTNFEKEIGLSSGYLSVQKKRNADIGESVANKINDYCQDLNIEWLLTGRGDMLKKEDRPILSSKKSIAEEETRPRIPHSAAAGSLTAAIDSIKPYDCQMIPVIASLPKYDFTILAYGDSMLPEYHSGDELAALMIKEAAYIQWGRVYILDTAQGILVKRIFDGGEAIICKSDNPDYGKFSIPKSEIYNIALVVGMLRRY